MIFCDLRHGTAHGRARPRGRSCYYAFPDDIIETVLKDAEESLEIKEQYRSEGFGFQELTNLVAEFYKLSPKEIILQGKQPLHVQARSLLCFWATRELGLTVTSIANRVSITQPAANRAIQRGKTIAQKNNYSLKKLKKSIIT